MIADHDRDRQSRDFQNMIVSDRRSRKKVSCLTLHINTYICYVFLPTLENFKILMLINKSYQRFTSKDLIIYGLKSSHKSIEYARYILKMIYQ